ncbi:cytochrome c biogenesis protein ResB [Fibrobacterota bacterium]
MWKAAAKHNVIRTLISYHLTTACLLLLLALTFWGTLYQVDHGLYAAKQRFFNSWFFLIRDVLPFPGGRLVLWIGFINLTAVTLFRFSYRWSKAGLILTHLGLLVLLAGASVTFHFSEESSLTFEEGEGANVSYDYHEWELAVWKQEIRGDTTIKYTEAHSITNLIAGDKISFSEVGAEVEVREVHQNCRALKGGTPPQVSGVLSPSGITGLEPEKVSSTQPHNLPGLIIATAFAEGDIQTVKLIILYAADFRPAPVIIRNAPVYFMLRRKAYILPITLTLLDFKKTEYPGTMIPKSFESRVVMRKPELEREVLISMNKPLRHHNYTFYQSSYSQSEHGEVSTLSVVRNPGRLLPYIGSLIISLGLFIHFCLMLWKYARRKTMQTHHPEPSAND